MSSFVKLGITSVFVALVLASTGASAQQVNPVGQPCSDPRAVNSPLCKEADEVTGDDNKSRMDDPNPFFGPQGVLTKFINTLSIAVGIIAVIAIIAAGFRFVVSGSNPQEVNIAREMILYACIALVLASVAQVIVRFWLNKVL